MRCRWRRCGGGGGGGGGAALSGPADLFAPPEAAAEMQLALDVEPVRKPARPPAPAPEDLGASGAPAPTRPAGASPVPGPATAPRAPGEPAWKAHARDERVRFVAGALLAAIVGGVPALVVASVRERSAFAELDGKLEDRQAKVVTRDDWDALDRVRASFVERKRAERQGIALTSLLIWAAVAGGAAWVWFRVIDWDRVLGPPPR